MLGLRKEATWHTWVGCPKQGFPSLAKVPMPWVGHKDRDYRTLRELKAQIMRMSTASSMVTGHDFSLLCYPRREVSQQWLRLAFLLCQLHTESPTWIEIKHSKQMSPHTAHELKYALGRIPTRQQPQFAVGYQHLWTFLWRAVSGTNPARNIDTSTSLRWNIFIRGPRIRSHRGLRVPIARIPP